MKREKLIELRWLLITWGDEQELGELQEEHDKIIKAQVHRMERQIKEQEAKEDY